MRKIIDPKTIGNDIAAGLTLGIESIPDAMASALLAAVNPIHGLYAVMLATPVGALFASSVFMSVQTTSAMSLVVASVPQVHSGENATASLLALAILTGVVMLILGLLKMGSMIRFVPNSVMTGFINAVAVMIVLGQLGDFTGYSSEYSNKVMKAVDTLFNLNQIHLQTLAVGIVTILLIVLLGDSKVKKFGLVIALAAASLLVPLFGWDTVAQVADIADIPDKLPRPTLPPLTVIPGLLIPALSLAFVGLVQGAGISQGFVNPDGKFPDSSGDFVGQGAANIAAGVFQGMPVGGSLSATSLVVSSGAKSRFGNISAGIVIAIMLLVFGSVVSSMAMPALAGLLIVVGFQTFKPQEISMVWKTGLVQQVVMLITFIATLMIPLQYAVLLGVVIAVLLYIGQQSNKVTIKEWTIRSGELPIEHDAPETLESDRVTVLKSYGSLFYAAAPVFEAQLPDVTEDTRNAAVILDLREKTDLGSTFLNVIERYAEKLQEHESKLMLAGMSKPARDQMHQTGMYEKIGSENIFRQTDVVGESLTEAYKQAAAWVASQGQTQAEPADVEEPEAGEGDGQGSPPEDETKS